MTIMYRTALIGCGRIGCLLENDSLRSKPCTHAGALAEVPEVDLVAACDIDEKRLRAFGKRLRVGRLYTDYRDLLRKENLDLLVVSSWTSTHAEVVVEAAERKVKGILCEKPLAGDTRDGLRMLKSCFSNGTRLVVNHERRFDQRYRIAKGLIESGAIGKPRTFTGSVVSGRNVEEERRRASVGKEAPLLHDGTHLFDIIIYLLGDVSAVSGTVEESLVVDSRHERSAAYVKVENGPEGWIECDSNRSYFHFEIDVRGTKGRIRIGNGFEELYLSERSRLYEGFNDLTPKSFPLPAEIGNPWVGAVREVVDCVEGERESVSSGLDALKSLLVVESIYLSSENGGRWIEILPQLALLGDPEEREGLLKEGWRGASSSPVMSNRRRGAVL